MAARKTPAKQAPATAKKAAAKKAAPRKTTAKKGKPGDASTEGSIEGYDIVLFVPDHQKTAAIQKMIDDLQLRPVVIALAKAYVSP